MSINFSVPLVINRYSAIIPFMKRIIFLFCCMIFSAAPLSAMDVVVVKTDSGQKTLEGQIIVTAQDGGVVLQDRINALHPVTPEEMISKTSDQRLFTFYTPEEIKTVMLSELPSGFNVHQTANYLVFYNTSAAFAQWSAGLFERLHDVFYNFWKSKSIELKSPPMPLIAIIFADKNEYAQFCESELGEAAKSIIGYYSMQTNRINMYDLTGADEFNNTGSRKMTDAQRIRRILAQPEAARMVATVVHEAAHQLAYNSGLQVRYADMPRWLSEGIAMYFETPDLKSTKGWGALGKDNYIRLRRFKQRLPRRNPEALKMMLTDDSLFTDLATAEDAYADAWALTWLLLKQQPKKFAEYMAVIAQKKPFIWDSKEQKLQEFEKQFGPWSNVNQTLIRVMKNK